MEHAVKVHFYLPNDHQISAILSADPDKDWSIFNTGVQVWVGQTFLRLRQLGLPVDLSSRIPPRGIVFTHADYVPDVMAKKPLFSPILIVAARADRPSQPYADFEIVQNKHSSDGKRALSVHHWPQPGLIPRDPARVNALVNITYKGMVNEMGDDFKSPEWYSFIEQNSLAWHCDAADWQGNESGAYKRIRWNDYSDSDLVVAIRRNGQFLHPKKPASKLINAWAAGVPAILGPEHAYRELRRSDLDYIEASTAKEVKAAIRGLRDNPNLYRAMVDNGLKRAQQLTAREIARQWSAILFSEVPRLATQSSSMVRAANTLKFRASKFLRGRQIAARR